MALRPRSGTIRGWRRLYASHPQSFDNIRIRCIPSAVKAVPPGEAMCERLFFLQVAVPAMLLIDYQMKDLDHSARSPITKTLSGFPASWRFRVSASNAV